LISALKQEFDNLKNEVESLSKIIKEGNGRDSLMTRIALLEQGFKSLESYIEDDIQDVRRLIEGHLEALKKEGDREEKNKINKGNIDRRAKWGIIIAIIGGLFGLLSFILKLFT